MNVSKIIMRKIKTIGAIALASIVVGTIGTAAEWRYMNISEGEENWLAFIFFASILSVLFLWSLLHGTLKTLIIRINNNQIDTSVMSTQKHF